MIRSRFFHLLAAAWIPGALLAALVSPGCSPGTPQARAYTMERLDQGVGGPASGAWVGDIMLENDHLRAALFVPRCDAATGNCSSPGPGIFGGSLGDIDLLRHDQNSTSGRGNDRFAELFGAINLEVMDTQEIFILADGADGGPAIVRAMGPAGNYISYIGLLSGVLGVPEMWQFTDYILHPGDPYLTIRTTALVVEDDSAFTPTDPCNWAAGDEGLPCDGSLLPPATEMLPLLDGMTDGIIHLGDFYMAGGDVDLFLPGYGFQEQKAVADSFLVGINTLEQPFAFPYLGGTADGVSYAISNGGQISAPLFSSSITAVFGAVYEPERDVDGNSINPIPGTAFTYQRFLGIGEGDVGSAVDGLYQAFDDHGLALATGQVSGHVVEEGSLAPLSDIRVLVFEGTEDRDDLGLPPLTALYTEWETDVGRDSVPDGSFGGILPVGNYLLLAKDAHRGPSDLVPLTITAGGEAAVGIVAPRPGVLEVEVVDEQGRYIPAKISLRPRAGNETATLPDLGDSYISGGFSKVVFAPYGQAQAAVPAGRYDVLVSRGLEYSLWNSVEEGHIDGVLVGPGQATRLSTFLNREVDSRGFISADFHVHAAPSHDSGVPLDTRVITMACEGVEFLAGTDHDYVTNYAPVIEDMGLGPWIQSTVGIETTTIELGHYLAFPLQTQYDAPQGGALDWTGLYPSEVFAGLRQLGTYGEDDTAVIVAHPRDGILGYFDQFGLDPFEGGLLRPEHDAGLLALANPILSDPEAFTLDFDALELMNGKHYEMVRTPTQYEMDCNDAIRDGKPLPECQNGVPVYDLVARTLDEQEALEDLTQDFYLTTDMEGQLDDWFSLLNLGFRHTAVGNSDTHGVHSVEGGCPRNYVVSDTDEPELIDERDVARAVREHRVVPSYGPLIDLRIGDQGIGSDVSVEGGTATLDIRIQSPRWMDLDRVELYENGRLIREFGLDSIRNGQSLKFEEAVVVTPTGEDGLPQDAWYVVVSMGDQDLSPVFKPIEVPKLQLNEIVVGALGGIDLGAFSSDSLVSEGPSFPRTYPMMPYGFTNPIWVDVDGDTNGDGLPFEALGKIPSWFRPAPEE